MAERAQANTAARGQRAGRTILVLLRESLLTLAAIGGAACIVLVFLAFTGGYSLIMFKTGSMSPTIPAGSVALVQETPASEIEVGDILTVDRPGALPVTHRVTHVAPGETVEERSITMKGDANDSEDPAPYAITEGRLVKGSVPHLAHIIVWFGNPWVLGGITIAAASVVTWAFWPRESKRGNQEDVASQYTLNSGTVRTLGRDSAARIATGLVMAGCLSMSGGDSAHAIGDLELRSTLDSGVEYPLGSDPLFWNIDAEVKSEAERVPLTVAMKSTGDQDLGMQVEVRSCEVEWKDNDCPANESLVHPDTLAILDDEWYALTYTDTEPNVHLQFALSAYPADGATGYERAEMTVRTSAGGAAVEATVGGGGELAETGSMVNKWGLFLAPAAILGGLLVAWTSRRSESLRLGRPG